MMNKVSVGDIFVSICVSYTIISVVGAIINMIAGTETNNLNTIAMFLFTSIAVVVLFLHNLLDRFSPLAMIVIQYLVAMGLVLLCVFIIGLFSPVSEGGYMDIFVSFTIPYIIGTAVYYVSVWQQAKQQNQLLQEIKQYKVKDE